MNTIGIALVWCMMQVTLVGLLAGGLYLLIRQVRRAAAAPVVLAGLTMVAALSLCALSPWPRWTLIDSAGPPAEDRGVMTARQDQTAESGMQARKATVAGRADIDNSDRLVGEQPEWVARPSPPAILWQTVAHELSTAQTPTTGWRWPAIVALVLLAAAACGLGWLLLGVAAVRRQRLRSQPVLDPAMLELIDVLRAELGCVRPVEVCQSDDLVTAATIGWRRPVVLLSSDWPTWMSPQLRAVLAHEIAHARSHDFLALVCGQLGVMLHFYHPLVHWLMSRLRLEQELAADAAAASVSGGQRQYLMTIAELALRQQERPLSWPARTFLPTQSTFLRRIAMLRDSKLRFDRLSPAVRFAVIGLVLLCGLLVAGLRGPGSQPQVLAAEPEKAVAEKREATTASNSASKSENILANPGAEKGEDYADDWVQGQAIDGVKYAWDKSTAFEGKASLGIRKTVNNYFPIAAWSQTVARTGDLPCLEVSAQVKTKRMYKAILDVAFLDESGQAISHKWAAYIGAKNEGDPPANHDWKKYSGTVQIPEGTAKLCIGLQDYGPGTVWFDDVQARYAMATADNTGDRPEVVTRSDANGKVMELKYDEGKAAGKRSFGGSGEMIRFTLPVGNGTMKGIRIHGSRYGMPQPPAEDFLIHVLSKDMSQTLFTETAPYKLFQRGKEKWVDVKFKKTHQVPKTFWIVLDFKAHQTKGVYVSFASSTDGSKHSKVGLPGKGSGDFPDGDWMIRALLSASGTSSTAEVEKE